MDVGDEPAVLGTWSTATRVRTSMRRRARDVNKDSRLKDKDQRLEFKDRNQGLLT